MLKNIKSTYFIKIIFMFLDERQKLKLVKYNKSFQNNINISILNYQHYKGCYIIFESKGIIKEYDGHNDSLVFEGECLNKQRQGKVKEYSNGALLFEGVYLNGKMNGKGKLYWNNYLTFEGEYLNGKKNGKEKEYYNKKGKLKFEGEYLNDKKWVGTLYDKKGNVISKLDNNNKGEGKDIMIFMMKVN